MQEKIKLLYFLLHKEITDKLDTINIVKKVGISDAHSTNIFVNLNFLLVDLLHVHSNSPNKDCCTCILIYKNCNNLLQ